MSENKLKKKVYLMGTCLVDSFFPEAGVDAISVLNSLGFEVLFPLNQSCCGQPAYNSGYENESQKVALTQMNSFSDDIPVIVLMGSCASMVIKDYPELFSGTAWQEQANSLADRTWEFGDFIAEQTDFESVAKDENVRVSLHISCSSRRKINVAHSHGKLVQSLKGVDLVRFENETECCGFGGTFAVKQHEISAEIAKDKAGAIEKNKPDYLISSDYGCLMNIGGVLDKQQSKIKVMHLASFLKERIA